MPTPTPESLTPQQSEILALWRRRTQLRADLKLSREDLTALRAQLGELLSRKRADFRAPGADGQFYAWLSANAISPTTAYRLMTAYEHPNKPPAFNKLLAQKCLDGIHAEQPEWIPYSFCADRLIVTLQRHEADVARRCLQALPPEADVPAALLDNLNALARQYRSRY